MQILTNVDLTSLNTFGLPVSASFCYELTNQDDLPELVSTAQSQNREILPLGGGSNIIFTQDYSGLVIRMLNKGIQVIENNDEYAVVEAQAGEIWPDFVQWTLDQGFSGLENLSLIPGTVGAAPIQNIGAYGVEVKDCFLSATCFDTKEKEFVTFHKEEAAFAYRDSIFKSKYPNRFIIVSVCFKLNKQFQPYLQYGPLQDLVALHQQGKLTPQQVADTVCTVRKQKLPDPRVLGNAGSFFKNPVLSQAQAEAILAQYPEAVCYPQNKGQMKFAAGWLIEQAGLKGKQIGGAAVHEKQALVLVNKSGATVDDLKALIQRIKETVQQKYGILLEAEPVFISNN